jgi:hypothetical protein
MSALDSRVQLLSKELDLDARQQAEVRGILLRQKAEVSQVWSDEATPAAIRVAATRAIVDKTADRIRAVLNDEQREKYIKPLPPEARETNPADLESYLQTTRPK